MLLTALPLSWAKTILIISCVGQYFCGMSCITAASRMLFAFSRDRAVPGHSIWSKIDRNRNPTNAAIAVSVAAIILTLPALYAPKGTVVPIAFFAVTSVTVIGLYQEPANIFAPPGADVGAILTYEFTDHGYRVDKTNALWIPVKPRAGVTAVAAQEAVTVALREMRRLRPADKNNFDLVSQDQILTTFTSITDIFFLVMIVLASVALLVGGIGVMAIMMVSVTARTREIGVRKALGATRRDILLQFLVEAATLTGLGGLLGILVGLAMGRLATVLLNIQADTPTGLTAIAVVVSVGIGLVFGVVPARRAARLDPIEALRYE